MHKPGPHSRQHDALGRAVRETRARRGLSQEDLGAAAGLHRNYIGAIERGEINPTFRVMLKLAHGLDVVPSELIKLTERRYAEAEGAVALYVPSRGGSPERQA